MVFIPFNFLVAQIGSLISQFSTKDGDYCVDGHLFLKKFSALQQMGWEEHSKNQIHLRERKQKILRMGQNPDILPKMLGR